MIDAAKLRGIAILISVLLALIQLTYATKYTVCGRLIGSLII